MTEDDLKKYRAMKLIISKGKFEIEGSAMSMAGLIFNWFEDILPKEIQTAIDYPPPKFEAIGDPVPLKSGKNININKSSRKKKK